MNEPLSPDEIEDLPGDGEALRLVASRLEETATGLTRAGVATRDVESLAESTQWRGSAFVAFRAGVERDGLDAHLAAAADAVAAAGAALRVLATRIDDVSQEVQELRHRASALGVDGEAPDELAADVESLRREYDELRDRHRRAIDDATTAIADGTARAEPWATASAPTVRPASAEVAARVAMELTGSDQGVTAAAGGDVLAMLAAPAESTGGLHERIGFDDAAAVLADSAAGVGAASAVDVTVGWSELRGDAARWLAHPAVGRAAASGPAQASADRIEWMRSLVGGAAQR